jgi:hypothetical protein
VLVLGLVFVLVLERVVKVTTCAIAHSLEGSRFAAGPNDDAIFLPARAGPKDVAAGGSRELPSAVQLYEPGANESNAMGEYIALRRFREPPVLIRFRRDQR